MAKLVAVFLRKSVLRDHYIKRWRIILKRVLTTDELRSKKMWIIVDNFVNN